MQKAVIIINPLSHQGKGWKRWLSIRSEVLLRLPPECKEAVIERGATMQEMLYPIVKQGESALIISAGGDGSIHFLLNYILKEEKLNAPHITMGAIGLGSSNDFLKPFGEQIKGIPVLINQKEGTFKHDAGIVTYYNHTNIDEFKYFIVNASVGVTAEANWNFNHPDSVLKYLKRKASNAGIIYTALKAILRHRNANLCLKFNKTNLIAPVSNINVLKVPFVSGSFYYNQNIKRDDGKLGLNICMNMSNRELISVLNHLRSGKFPNNEKTISADTKNITITSEESFVFEYDGETEKTRSLKISILENAISVLKN